MNAEDADYSARPLAGTRRYLAGTPRGSLHRHPELRAPADEQLCLRPLGTLQSAQATLLGQYPPERQQPKASSGLVAVRRCG
jgi:hypothetical protein